MKPDDISDAHAGPADPESAFDREEALARLEGDSELLAEMVSLFLQSHGEQVSEIKAGLARKDIEAVRRAAHALKGAIGNFTSRGAFQAAQRLEEIARRGDLAGAERAFTDLEDALRRLTSALVDFSSGRKDAC